MAGTWGSYHSMNYSLQAQEWIERGACADERLTGFKCTSALEDIRHMLGGEAFNAWAATWPDDGSRYEYIESKLLELHNVQTRQQDRETFERLMAEHGQAEFDRRMAKIGEG